MAGRPGTDRGPCGDIMMGYRDTWQQGWSTNSHPQLRGMCSPILPCKPHPQRVGQDREYFTCASRFYSNFPISPFPERAPTQSHADHWMWANPGPASRRWEQGYGLPDLQLSPRASEGTVLAAHPRWELASCFYLCIFSTKCSWWSGEPTEQTSSSLKQTAKSLQNSLLCTGVAYIHLSYRAETWGIA